MTFAFGTRTFSNFTSACLSAAMVLSCVWLMPDAFASTITSVMPSSPFVPGLRPTTVKNSATLASRTKSLVPFSTTSPPSSFTSSATPSVSKRADGSV